VLDFPAHVEELGLVERLVLEVVGKTVCNNDFTSDGLKTKWAKQNIC
jgi:hypothetical protein